MPSGDLAAGLRDVRDGQPLSPEIAVQLLTCDDELLPELLVTALELGDPLPVRSNCGLEKLPPA